MADVGYACSAFVTFQKQIGAHMAAQVLLHHEPYRMSKTYIEVSDFTDIYSPFR